MNKIDGRSGISNLKFQTLEIISVSKTQLFAAIGSQRGFNFILFSKPPTSICLHKTTLLITFCDFESETWALFIPLINFWKVRFFYCGIGNSILKRFGVKYQSCICAGNAIGVVSREKKLVIFVIPKKHNVLGRSWRYLSFYFTC